jgi:protein-tyrosine phosphatase
LADDYQGMLRRFRAQVAAVITTVARSGDGGVLVHCAAGNERTGLIVALPLGALGVAPEVVAEDYGLTADGLRAEEDRWLEEGPGDRADREATLARVRARPEVCSRSSATSTSATAASWAISSTRASRSMIWSDSATG